MSKKSPKGANQRRTRANCPCSLVSCLGRFNEPLHAEADQSLTHSRELCPVVAEQVAEQVGEQVAEQVEAISRNICQL